MQCKTYLMIITTFYTLYTGQEVTFTQKMKFYAFTIISLQERYISNWSHWYLIAIEDPCADKQVIKKSHMNLLYNIVLY